MPRPPLWPLVALARSRLARTPGARAGLVAAVVVALVSIGLALAVRGDGAGGLGGLFGRTGAFAAWLGGGAVALAAAHARALRDRDDGVEELAAMRGLSSLRLDVARMLAAMLEVALVVGGPLVALAIVAASLTGSARDASGALALGARAVLFAALTGVTLGGVAAWCGRARHGRSLLALGVVAPWIVADALGQGAWSIPGALGAALHLVGGGA